MANKSEPNAMNSELDPRSRPGSARIERLGEAARNAENEKSDRTSGRGVDRGERGELLRPSERPSESQPDDEAMDAPVEGDRAWVEEALSHQARHPSTESPHRMKQEDRADR